jgi:PAS domain S-box-containing protein
MRQTKSHRLSQSAAQAFLGTIATALVTVVFYRLHPDAGTAALLYLFVVVVVSLRGSLVASVWVSVLAVACLDYFFTPPLFRLTIGEPLDIVALIAFLTTALVINRLIFRMRQSFKEVEAAREQLQLVIDTVPTLLARTRPDGAIEFVNQQWRDFLGLSLEEIKGGGWAAALHPDDEGLFVAEWRGALESGLPLESEARMRRADGEYRWLLIRRVPLRDQRGQIVHWYGTGVDIEDRRRAEEKVRQADSERRTAIDRIPALVWSSLPDGSSDFNNKRWLEFTGLSEVEARDWGYKFVIHPEDYQSLVDEWAAHFATGVPIESEARLRRWDGQYRWFLHRAVPLRDEWGSIIKWYGTSTDIEDRKRAEETLRDHASLLDLTHDTVFVRDMGDAITYWNRGAEMLYGWSRDEAVGKVSHQLTQTIFPAPLDEINEELLRTGRWEGELVHTKRDGTLVVVASRWSIQRDELGRPAAILETNNDVTERKRAEAELRDHARLLDLSHDTVFVRDMSDAITYWNRGAETLYGWSRGEAVGKISHQLTQTIFPAPLDEINEELLRTGHWEGELVHARRDGTRVVVASRWSLQRDKLGRPAAILETNNDVTERKRAEEEVRESEGRYRHIFQSAGVSIWVEDFSEVKAAIDDLKAQGVTDFREYLATHPDFVLQAVSMVKIIDVNDTTLALLQARSKDELLVSLDKIFLPETLEVFAGELIAIAEGRTAFEAETVLQTMEGKRLSVLFTIAFPAESAALDSVLVTIMDITERKRLDNELRRSQAYLIAAQELGSTGSWAWRISTGEVYWSEEVFRIFGLEPRTTTPSRELMTQRCHADDRERADRTVDDAVRKKHDYEMDLRIVRPDGSIRYIHVRGQPVFDKAGETDEFIGVIMDVTNRRRTERALRRARERALEARFDAVLEERTRLARDIHDTLLQGFTGIALKLVAASSRVREPPESIEALRDLIGLAQQTLIDARRAVWDLRSPALAGGDFPAALGTALGDCVRGTTLELEYEVRGPPRPMDPDVEAAVVRVAQEAVTNVVKHAEARMVRVRLAFETRRVRLSVVDNGRGFVVASDFHTYGGHWGLLGMLERASQIRGRLALRSTPGQGTELVLLAPYAVADKSSAPHPASSSTPEMVS